MPALVYLRGTDPLEPRTLNASISLSERDRPIGVWKLKCQHWSLRKGAIHWSLEHFLQLGGPTSSSRRSGLNYPLCLSSSGIIPIEGIKTSEVFGTLLGSLCVAINLKTKGKGIACRTPFPGVSRKNERTKEQTNNQ